MKKCGGSKPCSANNAMVTKGQLSLMQCGFSKLLQRKIETAKKENSNYDSDHSSSDDQIVRTNVNSKSSDFHKCQSHMPVLDHGKSTQSAEETDKEDASSRGWLVLSDSEEEGNRESEDQGISKQSDTDVETDSSSIILPTQVPACQQTLLTKKVEMDRSICENHEDLMKEKDGLVLKDDSRQLGFSSTESNSSNEMSFEDFKNNKGDLKGVSDLSDESDDIEVSHNFESRKLRAFTSLKWKDQHAHNDELGNVSKALLQAKRTSRKDKESDSQHIDEFSSSEDNLPVEKILYRKRSSKCKKQRGRVQFGSPRLHFIKDTPFAITKSSSCAMRRPSASKTGLEHEDQKVESMDRYLGN